MDCIEPIGHSFKIVVDEIRVHVNVMLAFGWPSMRCTALTFAPADTASDAAVAQLVRMQSAQGVGPLDGNVEPCAAVC